ncbi:MAG: alpha-L-rhamnosidase, partial [Verrucomicrobia bacterium]|nr:alpha-L-rhamnosidase [Verrucomicrobiota bacterium]
MNRRDFIKASVVTGAAGMLSPPQGLAAEAGKMFRASTAPPDVKQKLPELQPARWLWYPSERCLPNTFVLFLRKLKLAAKPRRATGWIAADSRYQLDVNGRRIQWGPAPADPRWPEADPLDLTAALDAGENILGATVLFYGQGDGTWPIGKPGFLFWLEIEHSDGRLEKIVSDTAWRACIARAWTPGHYKRWYLRALQEEFDARLYPHGWTTTQFTPDANWLPAMELVGSPNRPALSTNFTEYQLDIGKGPANTELRPRSIPMLHESSILVERLTESHWLEWLRPPQEYFECRAPNAFTVVRESCAMQVRSKSGQTGAAWQVNLDGRRGAVLTFEFIEQVVGWPGFTIEAPAGTIVELLVHEGHQPGGPALINSHFDSWSRFICREGINRFETFDFESLRWLQLHVHDARGPITISDVGVRRRIFPWPNKPEIRVGEPALQRLMDAAVNTLHNCAQETLVDGMARERQQYSGDGGHQTHAIYLAFGETTLPARYLTTFSQGMTKDGFFLDCWPAYDRLARLVERQLDLSSWGPILDHGVGFNFDCWHHYLYTGDLDALREPYPRLLRFAEYLRMLAERDGLLPVEDLGIPSVWIDHNAYKLQRHKQCAFNLYAAAMFQHALAPLARAVADAPN